MYSTLPLYYAKPYETELSAVVLALTTYAGKPAVALDRTLFYPEGGGQPGDTGTLNEEVVVDTQKDEEGTLFHILENEPICRVGETVLLRVNWDHRYDYMQQHTAQHLLSGTMHRLFGIGTVSVHLGHDDLSIEIDSTELPVIELEDAVNVLVRQKVPVTAQIVTHAEAEALNLRRTLKVDGDVRIVSIGDFDTIACGGIHVADISELHHIHYLRSERIRGHLRTFWIAGGRAIEAIRKNQAIVDAVGTLLSSPSEHIVEGVLALQQQLGDAQYRMRLHAVQVAKLLLDQEIIQSDPIRTIPLVLLDASGWDEEYLKSLPEALLEVSSLALCMVYEREDGKLSWLVCLKGMADEQTIFQTVRKRALPLIEGKGGGRPPLWQGIGSKSSAKVQFLAQVKTIFLELLDE